jgi:phage terminase Nu1 subunit (DNA packaging protein)
MAAPIKGKITQAAMAEKAKVSVRTLQKWEKEGLDITDEAAVMLRADLAQGRKDSREDAGEAKLRKLIAEADRVELQVAKERGDLIAISEIDEVLMRLGAVVRAAIMRLEADLPPMLEGLSSAKMQKLIRSKVDEVLTALSDESAAIWKD